jgi:hypothetical protein
MFATPFIKTTLLQVLRALTAIAAASSACSPSYGSFSGLV